MKYISTRGNYDKVSAARAIQLGMVPVGGLFVPERIPSLNKEELYGIQNKNYQEIAFQILKKYLTDYTDQELKEVIKKAYNKTNFGIEDIAPLKKINDKTHILELWHGPTAAFKDMALQLMPFLLVKAIEKVDLKKEIVILVATSGDTGKAALEGFKDVPGVKIIVFYPQNGVSKIQEVQMVTTGGENTSVVAVEGNFDDCQNTVKEIFADHNFNQIINNNGYQFSSANSINWGRLVPQIIYYFTSYIEMVKKEEIRIGKKINITVPTGNFGNILAAYYAYRMGLPVNKFICASNDNKILTDFMSTGEYDINRDFKRTISPSMDILISSNLERFLFEVNDHDTKKIKEWYQGLKEEGLFRIDNESKRKIKDLFFAQYASEEETKDTIKMIYNKFNYLVDTHTAVGINVYFKYLAETSDNTPVIIDSTANPYKFSSAVLESITDKIDNKNEYEILKILSEKTDNEIHRGLRDLDKKKIRHKKACTSSTVRDEILNILDIN